MLESDPRSAIQLLSASTFSSDPEALYLRGVAFFRLGEFTSAESSFRGTIALDATRADAFYYLGLALERQSLNTAAVKAYRAAFSLDPSLTKARDKLTQLAAATPNAQQQPRAAERRGPESELMLPDEEREFDDYERRKRRKAAIDYRADFDAQITGMPTWAKAVSVLFFAGLLSFMGWVFFNLFTR